MRRARLEGVGGLSEGLQLGSSPPPHPRASTVVPPGLLLTYHVALSLTRNAVETEIRDSE